MTDRADLLASIPRSNLKTLRYGFDELNIEQNTVGIETANREEMERLVNGVADSECEPTIDLRLDCERLPRDDGTERPRLLVGVPRSPREVHRTGEACYLRRGGAHRFLISTEHRSGIGGSAP